MRLVSWALPLFALLLSGCTSITARSGADIGAALIAGARQCEALDSASASLLDSLGSDINTAEMTRYLAELYPAGSGERSVLVFLDGTWNTSDSETNIWRLYVLSARAACSGRPIVPRYFRGVGTDERNRIWGGLFGNGLDELIQQGYTHLAEHYDPDDKVFLFGFSRGAYAARSLNGFIEFAGLIDVRRSPVTQEHVERMFRRYNQTNRGWAGWEDDLREEIHRDTCDDDVCDPALYRGADKVVVEAIGVFDTVAALGLTRDSFPDDHRTGLYARRGFHALSLDEQRRDFAELRFYGGFVPDQLQEVWFPGGHGDVGGGYGGGLELIPLHWMLDEMKDYRLFAEPGDALSCASGHCVRARLHDQFLDAAGTYERLGLHYRRPVQGDSLHRSVLCRQAVELEDAHCHGRKEVDRIDDPAAEAACVTGRERRGVYAPANLIAGCDDPDGCYDLVGPACAP